MDSIGHATKNIITSMPEGQKFDRFCCICNARLTYTYVLNLDIKLLAQIFSGPHVCWNILNIKLSIISFSKNSIFIFFFLHKRLFVFTLSLSFLA